METLFKQIINETVKPLLKREGFKKKALNFHKNDDGLFFLINIQKSHGNSSTETGFYINCAIHSQNIDRELGFEVKELPKEYECHSTTRIENIATSPDKFIIDGQTNVESTKRELSSALEEVINHFNAITDTQSFIEYMSKNGTRRRNEVFQYCIRKGLNNEAKSLVERFHKNIDAERWERVFKGNFIEIIEEEKSDLEIDCLK